MLNRLELKHMPRYVYKNILLGIIFLCLFQKQSIGSFICPVASQINRRSKRSVRELLGFSRGPVFSPLNPKKIGQVNMALGKEPRSAASSQNQIRSGFRFHTKIGRTPAAVLDHRKEQNLDGHNRSLHDLFPASLTRRLGGGLCLSSLGEGCELLWVWASLFITVVR
jgi:hypothetical protein